RYDDSKTRVASADVVAEEAAEACFSAAIGKNAKDSFSRMSRARIYSRDNKLDRAVEDWTVLIEQLGKDADPDFRFFYIASRANLLTELGRAKPALDDCNQLIKIHDDSSEAYRMRGNAWEKAREWQQALDDYRAALSREPESSVIHFDLA